MPRIDPLQLLRCLSVLLGPNGGILSKEQVSRLASLMVKFSKKLVSKCIYVLILKNTKTELIGLFMSEGGWALTNSWLADAIEARNWPLMQELLELLLMCPVDVERLKLNNCPKLVKGLSKDSTDRNVQLLATRLVAQWLQIVKGPSMIPQPTIDTPQLLPLEAHHSIMVPQGQPQMMEILREEDGHSNFSFPSDSSMQLDLNGDLFCELPSDFETISKDDLLSVSESLCELRGVSNNALTSAINSSSTGEVISEIESDALTEVLNVVRNEALGSVNCVAPIEAVSEMIAEDVKEEAESMEIDSSTVSNGVQEKLVLKLNLKDGKKIVLKSPTKRKLSEEEEESSPAKRKAKEQLKEKRKQDKEKQDKEKPDKDKSEKLARKHDRIDKTDKKSTSERRGSKDSSKDFSKNEPRQIDSKSKHHHHTDKTKDKNREKEKEKSKLLSAKDKEKERERLKLKEKERIRLKEKEKAETQAEKDKATLAKIMQPSVSKLGKIPKKTDSSRTTDKVHPPVLAESKKISISIENRKQAGEPRPKTVKTFPTKFRSTGLEESVKPPPSRKEVKKPVSVVSSAVSSSKDTSSLSLPGLSSEKRAKPLLNMAGPPERPGAIKLIPAKPKSGLQDSDFFMDALNAANLKREPRKRKRRTSGSKDESSEPRSPTTTTSTSSATQGDSSPASTSPSSSPERPAVERASEPRVGERHSERLAEKQAEAKPVFKFYQETLQLNDESKDDEEEDEDDNLENLPVKKEVVKKEVVKKEIVKKEADETIEDEDSEQAAATKERIPVSSPVIGVKEEKDLLMEREKNRLPRGVLVFHRGGSRPRKSLKWKADSELESVHYFELDETERVNVTKTSFLDMKQMERVHERENFHMARRMSGEDQMKEHTVWAKLIPIDLPASEVEFGSKSREREVQFAREKSTPASPIYLKNIGNPDSPSEPDPVSFTPTDPVRIPLEDVTGPNSVNDFTNTPWPEPKPLLIPQSPPHSHTISHSTPLLQTPIMGPNSYHSAGGDWRTGDGKVVIPDIGMAMNPGLVGMGPGMMGSMTGGMDAAMTSGMGAGMGPGMGPVIVPGMGPAMVGPGMIGPNMGMDMYNQNGMDGNWNPDMNYGMMGGPGPDMYPMDQGNYDMYQGSGFGANPSGGPGFSRGRSRGWYRGSGESWRGGRGRGGWSGSSGPPGPSKRGPPPVCRYFRRGLCKQPNCQFLHPQKEGGSSGRH